MFPRVDQDFLGGLRAGLGEAAAACELTLEPGGPAADPRIVTDKLQRLLLQHRPHVVVGIVGSAMLRHVHALFSDARVPFVVNNLGAEPLLDGGAPNEYVFHNSFNLWQSMYALGSWAARTLGRRAALASGFHDSGYGIVPAFWSGFCDAGGGEIVATEVTNRDSSEEDPSVALQRLADAKPDLIVGLYAGRSALSFMQSYDALGLAPTLPLISSAFLMHRQWLGAMGDTAIGVRTAFSWDRDARRDEDRAFHAACAAAELPDPDVFALLGYETGKALADAAARCGDKPSGDAVREALPLAVITSPRGEFSFDASTGEVPTKDYLLEVQRGEDGAARLATVGTLDLPERYAAEYAAYRAQEVRTGWTNAYMIT